jgi:hypothetical protein
VTAGSEVSGVALSERSRSVLYQGLVASIGDETAVSEMMAYFPARDVEEPVTKEFLRAELATVRAEMLAEIGSLRSELHAAIGSLRSELHAEIGSLRSELHAEIGSLRSELRAEIGSLRSELHAEIGSLRSDLETEAGGLRAEMVERIHRSTVWTVGAVTAWSGVLLTAMAVLR